MDPLAAGIQNEGSIVEDWALKPGECSANSQVVSVRIESQYPSWGWKEIPTKSYFLLFVLLGKL